MISQLAAKQQLYNANPVSPVRAYTTRAIIDLGQLKQNAQIIKDIASPSLIMAVVKSNAYGHGVLPVVQTLLNEGYNQFMVATLSEALHLRACNIHAPILVAMPPLGANLPLYAQENLLVSVSSEEVCREVLEYARGGGSPIKVHVKLDTGMHRLGLSEQAAFVFMDAIGRYPHINVQGIWTHLATAGASNTTYARKQISSVQTFLNSLNAFDGIVHIGNSSSLIHEQGYLPPMQNTMYRVGGGLLGISALPDRARQIGLQPIMTLKSHVLAVKPIAAGDSVSYGRNWIAPADTRIAVVGSGYADGYPCTPPKKAKASSRYVVIHGRRYPVIGSVCMDMFMVDLGLTAQHIPVQPGDEVILFGSGGPHISEVARETGKKAYEISCSISQRVVRDYI